MTLVKPLLVRIGTMLVTLFLVLALIVVTFGATGHFDRLSEAVISEELRALRISLAETIRDPDELDAALAEHKAEMEAAYGIDQPWYTRLPDMAFRLFRLDLGDARTMRSFDGSSRVADIVLERLPNTVLLVTTSMMITAGIGIMVGVRMASQAGSSTDRVVSYVAAVTYGMPTWWVGILMLLLFAYYVDIFPSGGMQSAPPPDGAWARFVDRLYHAALPILTLVLASAGPYIYAVRTLTLNIAHEDHITLARAKGLPEGIVVRRHILWVAAPPIVTGLIFGLIASLSGSILVETVFNWPGMGRLFFEAIIGTPDEAIVIALTYIFAVLYVVARIILEVLYLLLDPRVRY